MGQPISLLILHSSSEVALQIISECKARQFAPLYQAYSQWEEGERALEVESWDLVVAEEEMQGQTALDFFGKTKEKFSLQSFLILAKSPDREMVFQACKKGVYDVVSAEEIYRIPLLAEKIKKEKLFKKDKDIIANFLEHSLLELQFQKFAMDQASIVSITDAQGIITYVNQAFLDFTGYDANELIGNSHRILKSERNSTEFWKGVWTDISSGKVWKGEVQNRRKDGSPYWSNTTIVPFFGKDGSIFQYIAIHFDITDRKLAEEQLTHDAFYDSLTDLPNKALFLARIEQKISDYRKENLGFPVVISVNIDNFKRINNSLGYSFGDKVLQAFGKRLINLFRFDAIVSHLNADQFAILTWAFYSEEEAFDSCKAWQEKLKEMLVLDGYEIFLTASFGIASYGLAGKDAEEILGNSEIAMFHSKANGIGLVSRFTVEMRNKNIQLLEIQNDLKKALERNEFVVFFQPIHETKTNQICHWEALVRWKHPKKGMVSPLDFIPMAEASGLIVPITRFVFEQSAEFIQSILHTYHDSTSVAVNVSPEVFYHQNVLQWVLEIGREFGIDARLLQIEITESLAIRSMEDTVPVLQQLKDVGLKVSLDDFGTGYSSLSYLENLPLSNLKIDKSFLQEVIEKEKKKKLLSSIIGMAHDLHLEVVTEGVETEEQWQLLRNLGCDMIQGYYYSKPLPRQQAMEYWNARLLV